MKPCIYLGLEADKPEAQLVRGGHILLAGGFSKVKYKEKNTFLHPMSGVFPC